MSIANLGLTVSHGHAVSRWSAALMLRAVHQVAALAPVPRMPHAPQILHDAPLIFELDRKVQRLQNISLNLVSQAQAANDPPVVTQVAHSDEELSALYEDLVKPTQIVSDVARKNSESRDQQETSNAMLAAYASKGDTDGLELYLNHVNSGQPTETQRDLYVKAHLVKSTVNLVESCPAFPTSALETLHRYEASGHPAPIKSYTRVICALFSVRTSPSSSLGLGHSAAHAQAWDLFAHMRYVAHPTPDAHLYAVMIRACGTPTRPEPERALDLWTEMLENKISPTKGAYEAIVLVCGRAGQEWLGEGIRLAREMDKYLPGVSGGRQMWCALLEGCKRIGDLKRARWILAEALRSNAQGDMDNNESSATTAFDAKMMSHVFHTYASYTPPFKRSATRIVEDCPSEDVDPSPTGSKRLVELQDPEHQMDDINPSFSRLPPQTASDVIAEVQALFERIISDTEGLPDRAGDKRSHDPLAGRFAQVKLTPFLLNAYISVFYAHAPIEHAREVFSSLFVAGRSSFPSNVHTFVDALERCSLAFKEERIVARQWAQELWLRWHSIETQAVGSGHDTVGPFSRLIERAHTAMRRILTLTGDLDEALALLRDFVGRYPPSALFSFDRPSASNPSLAAHASMETFSIESPKPLAPTLFAKPPILSTRTVLVNPKSSGLSVARPLVRLTSAIGPRDDRVPPLIGFADVELLHHRLAARRRVKDLAYLKWLCNAYGGALRKRRELVLKAVPQNHQGERDQQLE